MQKTLLTATIVRRKKLQNQRDIRHAEGGNCRGSAAVLPKKIVEKSSNIAQKAAAEAKAASEAQNIAGQQAARQVLEKLYYTYHLSKRHFARDATSLSRVWHRNTLFYFILIFN